MRSTRAWCGGLDYYVRTTFEVLSGDIGAQAAVAGGGRYNGLMRDLGGPDLSAAGFACGMERLALLLPDAPAPRPDFYLAALDSGALGEIFALAQALRAQGLMGEAAFAAGSLKSRLRQAQKNRARTCLILGADELAAGRITIKDMDTGQQSELPLGAVADIAAAVGRAG